MNCEGTANEKVPELPEVPEGMDRPFIVVNCAASADGKLALPDGQQTRISSEDDMAYVHRLRNWADAVIVGINTVIKDDPKLTVKEKFVPDPIQPLRVVIDSCFRTPPGSQVLNNDAPTLIATTSDHWPFIGEEDVETIECGTQKKVDLEKLVKNLWERGIRKVMVEGGGTLISSFLEEGVVDMFMVFIGDMLIGGRTGPSVVMGSGASSFDEIYRLERVDVFPMDGGVRIHYKTLE